MYPWILDTISPYQCSADTLAWNSFMADSSARWFMNQANMASSCWMGLPYAFPEDMFNPVSIWNNACASVQNGGNNWGSNVWGNFGWQGVGGTSTTTTKKKDDKELEPSEQKAKEKYEQLKNLLKDFAEKVLKDEDEALYKEIMDVIKDTKKTYSEKCAELEELYKEIDKDDLKKYIEEHKEVRINGKERTVSDILIETGDSKHYAYTHNVTNIRKGLESVASNQSNTNEFLSSIKYGLDEEGKTQDNVLGIISEYNDNGNFAADIRKALNNASDKETAMKGIKDVVNVFTKKAEDVSKYSGLDKETADLFRNKIKALNDTVGENSLDTGFEKAFNELYILTRLTVLKLAEKSLNNKYGLIDSSLITLVSDAKDDLKNEKLGLTETEINDLTDKVKVKVKPERQSKADREKEAKELNEKEPEEKIQALKDGDILCEAGGATCDGEQVYIEKHGFNKRYFILDEEDGLFYEVEQNTVTGNYSLKASAAGIKASSIKDSGDKAKTRDDAQNIIETPGNDNPLTKTNKFFKGPGDDTTTNGHQYEVYEATIGNDKKCYILNDDAKLEEVKEESGKIVKVLNVPSKSFEELKHDVKKAKDDANDKRKENIKNPIKEASISLIGGDGSVSIGRSENRWKKDLNHKHFSAGLGKLRTYYKWNASAADNTVNEYGYTKDDWNNAIDSLISYYEAVYRSLGKMNNGTKSTGFAGWCTDIFKGNGNKEFKRSELCGADYATVQYECYDYSAGKKVTKNLSSKDTSVVRINDNGNRVNTFDKVRADNGTSQTGLYIGCDFDCDFKWIGFGRRNEFYFFLDSATVLEKFKSFLPK